jgi:type IV pilus assembly protein PilN
MIRINLLGQARPKAAKQAIPLDTTVQFLFGAVAVGLAVVILGISYYQQKHQLDETQRRIDALKAEKASLQQVKADVDKFEQQKSILQQRIDVIETLQKNRSGAQDMMQMVANTVVRIDSLWLTSLDRKGDAIVLDGEAGSINAVANFITELKKSGYFQQVEIKNTKENDLLPGVETYGFEMTVSVAPPASGQPATQATSTTPPPAPAAKGRS